MKTKNYSAAEKSKALKLYHAAREDGETAADAAGMAGIPYITLRLWERADEVGAGKGTRPAGRPRKASVFQVVFPDGRTLENENPEALIKALRAALKA